MKDVVITWNMVLIRLWYCVKELVRKDEDFHGTYERVFSTYRLEVSRTHLQYKSEDALCILVSIYCGLRMIYANIILVICMYY
jgi:hypothetical protein